MFYLVLHTALLILATFIIGAIAGCLLRRFFGAAKPATAGASAPTAAGDTASKPAKRKRKTPAESAAAAAAAVVTAQTSSVDEAAERAAAETAAKTAQANKPKTVEEPAPELEPEASTAAVPDEAATAAALAALPADATNEDKANAVGSRPTGLEGPRGDKKDNLQRIKGIGKVNEGKLNDLGIYHFDQLANWTPSEALWVGTFLSFAGRIEREDWIGQAKILAEGGETDFAKRVDKGDVATSKPKKS